MKRKLIHLTCAAALSLAAICEQGLRAQEYEPCNFEVETSLVLYADEIQNAKRNELAYDIPCVIPKQATNEGVSIPQEPPTMPPTPPLQVFTEGWSFSDYIYRTNIDFIFGDARVEICGGQPPYTVTVEEILWLYKTDYIYNGRPNGSIEVCYVNHPQHWLHKLFFRVNIPEELNEPNPDTFLPWWDWSDRFKGVYRGEGKIIVSDAVGNCTEALFPVCVSLY